MSMEPTNTPEQTNIMFNNGHHAMLSQPLKQMVTPYLWIEFCVFLVSYLDTSTFDFFNKFVCNPWYDGDL
jgi:hypothetical protein